MSSRVRSASSHPLLLAVMATITLLACGGAMEPKAPTDTPLGPPVGLTVSPSALSLIAGGYGALVAHAFDSKDRTVRSSFEWSSADPTIASVGRTDGFVTAIAVGVTTVTATTGTLSATTTVSVRPPDPPVAISIAPAALSLIPGVAERLTARATDSTGRPANVSFEWSSADPTVATVGKIDGVVTAIAAGSTTVTAAVGALRATATVSVVAVDGSFAFTRWTRSSDGSVTSDVLSYSVADLTMRSLPRTGQFASIAAPAWSTDGARVAVEVIHTFFPYREDGFDYVDYNSDLYVLDAGAPAEAPWRALTTNGLSKSPSWSPDGTRIAYLQQPELFSATNAIYIMGAAGGTSVRLTRTQGWYSRPRWSPDGTRLAFSMYEEGGSNWEVFIVNADGSGLTNVTRNPTSDFDPSWSPDGARLVFISYRANGPKVYVQDVFVVDVDGSNVTRLTSMAEYSLAPAWSADGRQIIFSSGRSLYLMNADGSSLVRLTTPPPNSWDDVPVWRR